MRKIHFVGSLPVDITKRGPYLAMDWALAISGWYEGHADLTGVPCDLDPRWIIDYLDRLADRAAFRPLRPGNSSDYDHMPLYRVITKSLYPADVALDRTDELKAVINDYRKLRENERQRPDRSSLGPMPPLRLSLPCPVDLALFVFCGKADFKRHPARTARGTWLALRNLSHFIRAMVAEVTEVNRYAARHDVAVVWQLEAPSVLYAMNLAPRFLRAAVARVLAELIANMIGRLWDFDVELHLCDGDLGHKAITRGTPAQMVAFLNRLGPLLDDHGCDRPPVHLPFACGDQPAPTDAEWYAPLARLQPEWTIYAGVVDEHNTRANWAALHHVESCSGRVAAAVAAACGHGRRSIADTEDNIEACIALIDVDRPDSVKDSEERK